MRGSHLRRSQKQERRIAAENGGTVNPQSGAGWIRKNDVRTASESWEAKTTTKQQFTLKVNDLITAWLLATVDRRRMVFEIEFPGSRWVVLQADDYRELRDRTCGEGCTGYGCDICGRA